MELDSALKERRSVREYQTKKVPKGMIMDVLDAGRYAPKSGNLQNFYFIIVENQKKRNEISEYCLKQEWMKNAPVHIVVCNKVSDISKVYSKKGELFSIQNSSAAIQNILLKATDLGLGSCWVGALDSVGLQKVLRLPEGIRVEAVITLGYSKKVPKTSRKLNLDRITYFEEWGKSQA